jgi:hypothetical protein
MDLRYDVRVRDERGDVLTAYTFCGPSYGVPGAPQRRRIYSQSDEIAAERVAAALV